MRARYNTGNHKNCLGPPPPKLGTDSRKLVGSERPRSLLLSLGVPSRPLPRSGPGPIPGPKGSRPDSPCALFYSILDPSRSRGGGHPGPSWSHPAPERSFQDRAWTGRNRLLGHFRWVAANFLLFFPYFLGVSKLRRSIAITTHKARYRKDVSRWTEALWSEAAPAPARRVEMSGQQGKTV